jgi:purine-binding chemotaxis protein CheW
MQEETHARQLLVFSLGAGRYGVPIDRVHDIIGYQEPRAVASRIEWMRGLITLRGRILPVYDLTAYLHLPPQPAGGAEIVILDTGSETAGVLVDGPIEVLSIRPRQEHLPGAPTVLNPDSLFARREPVIA